MSGRRALRIAAALAIVGLGLAVALRGPTVLAQARVGTGFVAKQVCSCLFVAGRELSACRADVPAGMDAVDAEALGDGVRASVLGVVSSVARHHPGAGCTLE